MVETVLRYRHYGCGELQRFFGDTVFYSRSSHFRANCPGRPDVIRTAYQNEYCGSERGGLIRITLELDKCRNSTATAKHQGLRLHINKPQPAAYKLRVREGRPTADIILEARKIMDSILANLPIVMYATALARQVRNYADFMSSSHEKKHYRDIAALIEQRRIKSLSSIPLTHYGLVENGGTDMLHVVQLLEGDWVAWIDGDDLIPAFPDELQAYRFMKDRLSLYEGFKRTAYNELKPPFFGSSLELT